MVIDVRRVIDLEGAQEILLAAGWWSYKCAYMRTFIRLVHAVTPYEHRGNTWDPPAPRQRDPAAVTVL